MAFSSPIPAELICLEQEKTELFTVTRVKYYQYLQENNIDILFCSVLPWMDKMDLVCLGATIFLVFDSII